MPLPKQVKPTLPLVPQKTLSARREQLLEYINDDGFVKSDNKHTYGGYKPFYRSVVATYVSENEFKGI